MDSVTTKFADGLGWIEVDDGKVNAMSVSLLRAIDGALDEVAAAGSVAVLAGRDGIFSAGFDMGTFQRSSEEVREMLLAGAGLIERLLAFPRPVVAMCTGHAYPMGAFLMLASDVRIGARGPWRIGMNEVAVPLTVPYFALEIARHRLTPAAFASVKTAEMYDPEAAVAAGYLDRTVDAAELRAAVEAEAQRVAAYDTTTFAATKERVNADALTALRAAVRAEFTA